MNILIVEDDYISQTFLKNVLNVYGNCETASDGFEAVDMVMNYLETGKAFSLICVDVIMPKMDGITLVRAVRDLEKKLLKTGMNPSKIIITTADSNEETVKKAYESGANAYMFKPIDTVELASIISRLKLDNLQ